MLKLFCGVWPIQVEGDHLSLGVHTGIGAPCREDGPLLPIQAAQTGFNLALDGTGSSLALEALEVRAIVSKYQLVTCHLIRLKSQIKLRFNQLDQDHFGVIAQARSQFQDTRITTVARGVAGSNVIE